MEAQFDHNQSLRNVHMYFDEKSILQNLLDEPIADEIDGEQVTVTGAGAHFGHRS